MHIAPIKFNILQFAYLINVIIIISSYYWNVCNFILIIMYILSEIDMEGVYINFMHLKKSHICTDSTNTVVPVMRGHTSQFKKE